MKFWKFEFPGDAELDACISDGRLPNRPTHSTGLANTDEATAARLRVGDAVIIATLIDDQAKIFALGRVRSALSQSAAASIKWVKSINFKTPDERGGLIHWQTKTAFEISAAPAKRYGLAELVTYYVKE